MKAKSATKGRCWKGCKPVPGKKPYSKDSCSCGMSALAPGMIEFVSDEGRAAAAATLRYNKWIDQNPKADVQKNPHWGDFLAAQDRVHQRAIAANKMGWPFGKKARARRAARKTYNEDIDYMNSQLRGLSSITPGMIEFARGDRAIPALKKALAKGIGNAGEPVSISEIGVSGTMVPSLRGNAKNVQRATKKFWGEDEGLGQATGAMRYNRDWAAKTIKESRRGFESLTPGMVAFALGEDNRPRNNNGQFLANETGGADPNSMAAAYGNVEAEKMARRQSLMGRLKAMMGR